MLSVPGTKQKHTLHIKAQYKHVHKTDPKPESQMPHVEVSIPLSFAHLVALWVHKAITP